jgi:cis-3-alkyl-4-acyloxetan-2-one decarboxylase
MRKMQKPMSDDQWRSHYPFTSKYMSLPGARMHYVDEGQGRPILMVHGNPTWSFYYRKLIQAFRDEYRVVAADHVGCGLSDKPQHYPYTLARRIQDLVDLVKHLDLEDITLVGHDWGGAIGLGVAERVPKRFARIVLLNTGAFPGMRVPWRIRACRIPWLGSWLVRKLNVFSRAALRMAVVEPRNLTPAARAGLLAPYNSWESRVAVDAFVKDIPLTKLHPTWHHLQVLEAGLPFLASRPTLFVWGMRDWCFTPACLERLRQSFPEAEVRELHRAGHYVLEDAPHEVIHEMRGFLARTEQQVNLRHAEG